ncbi:unnamed protein product [Rotaria sordida]|uniref:Uncharacterized protein n=1 Tax=Rotaria sordida TaxID=392033 RepID=A0A813UV82_9BILA|nr:unnamed protein product [Rotaria sordida]
MKIFKRSDHSAVIYNSSMYIFGGLDEYRYNNLFKFDFDTHIRTEIKAKDESKLSLKRCKHSACIYDNMMYIFGGCGKCNDCHSFDFRTLEWTELKYNNDLRVIPAKCGRHTYILYGGNLYMFDGYVGIQRSNELFVLNL